MRTRTDEDDQESFGIFDCELIVRLTAMMTVMMTAMMMSMMTVMMTTMMTARKGFDRESIVRPTPPTTYNVQRSSVRRVISEL